MLIDGEEALSVPADDRGLAYGDGLFETIRIRRGKALFLEQHVQRLQRGCAQLALTLPDKLEYWLRQAVASAPQDCILKLILTRGSGGRGYRPPAHPVPRCIISLHPLPDYGNRAEEGAKVFVCRQKLAPQGTLAGIKHLNRLEQVLASGEFPDDSFHEGLMCDYSGHVIEGTRSNLFLARDGGLLTPSLTRCGIEGIMRDQLIGFFGGKVRIADVPLAWLESADEVFLCNSVFGVWPVVRLLTDERELDYPVGSHTKSAREFFANL